MDADLDTLATALYVRTDDLLSPVGEGFAEVEPLLGDVGQAGAGGDDTGGDRAGGIDANRAFRGGRRDLLQERRGRQRLAAAAGRGESRGHGDRYSAGDALRVGVGDGRRQVGRTSRPGRRRESLRGRAACERS